MLGHDAVVIVSTNSEQKRNSDVTYPFRPDSNFWYLGDRSKLHDRAPRLDFEEACMII